MNFTPRKVTPDEMKVVYASAKNPKFNPGRRAEIKYRDMGTEEATRGEVRAEVMHVGEGGGLAKPTGWHYHTADIQLLTILEGWVKMEFTDLGVITLEAGDHITIPGGCVHQELSSSSPMRALEVSIPAKLGTVDVETPEWGQETHADYGEISAPQKAGHAAD